MMLVKKEVAEDLFGKDLSEVKVSDLALVVAQIYDDQKKFIDSAALIDKNYVNMQESITRIFDAFPGRDTVGHYRYHADKIEAHKNALIGRREFFQSIITWAAKGIIVVFLSALVLWIKAYLNLSASTGIDPMHLAPH